MNSLLRRLYREQGGQALYLVAGSLIAILGMAALSIDIGFALHAQRELQANTDAAASAGGAAMPNPNVASVYNVVTKYSGSKTYSATYNLQPGLNITNVTVSLACLSTTTYAAYNLPPCVAASSYPSCGVTTGNPSGGCNAIKVVETATEPTFFGKMFGINTFTLTATAIASASGGSAVPYHVVVALDSTESMGSTNDTGCLSTNLSGTYTAEQCAQLGVQTLLAGLAPCPQGTSNCAIGSAVDPVALMTFPGLAPAETSTLTYPPVQGATANTDYDCSSSTSPTITSYNNNPDYLVLPFQNDYRTSDTSGLNWGSSHLLNAVAAGTSGCQGIQTPGGEKTFYAGVLLEAQAYLGYNHASNVQDIIIFLSDGSANAPASPGMVGSVAQTVNIAGLTGSKTFSTSGECTQAVNAANYDKGLGTEIYSISYNSGASGCTSGETSPYTTPCATMQGISSTPLSQYFYSVPNNITKLPQCANANQVQYLYQVFYDILGQLESARLIPQSVQPPTGSNWVGDTT
jgi:hypothetical protein